jgi:trypsin
MRFGTVVPMALMAFSFAVGGIAAAPPAQAISGGVSSTRPSGAVQLLRNGDYECGGTLVAQRFVVTARHCFLDDRGTRLPLGSFRVRVGDSRRGQGEQHGVCQTYETIGVVTGGDQAQGAFSDILVIQLNGNVDQTDQIIGVSTNRPALSSTITIRGWGQSGDLRQANMRVNAFNARIGPVPDGMELRRGTGISQKGDSGGPVTQGGALVGVIAEGQDSPEATIAVEVRRYHDWILRTLRSPRC